MYFGNYEIGSDQNKKQKVHMDLAVYNFLSRLYWRRKEKQFLEKAKKHSQ